MQTSILKLRIRKRTLTALTGVLLLLVMGMMSVPTTTTQAQTGTCTPTNISNNTANDFSPAINGDRIVWWGNADGDYDIYLYEISTGTTTNISNNTANDFEPAINGDRIVWRGNADGDWDIYLYEISTGTTTNISNNTASDINPAIDGNRIVWQGNADGDFDIYLYEISTGTTTNISNNTADDQVPAINGDRIVWQGNADGDWDIYLYEISTGTTTNISNNTAADFEPAINGDRIVWRGNADGDYDIYLYEISSGTTTNISNNTVDDGAPAINGDRIVWNGNADGDWDIYLYEISTGTTTNISNNTAADRNPAINGDRIVWYGNADGDSDIYYLDLSGCDEPPTAIAQDITVFVDASGNVTVLPSDIDGGSTDDNGITSMTINGSPSVTYTCANLGANNATLTVTDANNQSDSDTAIVTVNDTTAPSAVTQNITIQLDASGNASITVSDINNGSSDNCGIASLILSQSTFTTADLGPNTVTLTVTDLSGNQSSANATVTVEAYPVGSITIIKDEVPDNNQDFNFEIRNESGVVASPTVSEGNSVTIEDLPVGSYEVEELFGGFGSGYVFGGAECDNGATIPADPSGNDTTVSFDLAASDDVTCTFTNQQRVSLVIYKETLPDGDPTEFTFTQDFRPTLGETFVLTDGNFQQYVEGLPGTFTVTEELPENWQLNDVTCDGGEVETLENGIEITLEYGDSVTCVFTNEYIPPPSSITIIKDVVYDADIDIDSDRDFLFFSEGLGNFSLDDPAVDDADGVSNTQTFEDVEPGEYTITENPNGNWNQSVECIGDDNINYVAPGTGAIIDLDAGEDVVCTFTNERVTYSLTYEKELVNGTPVPSDDWVFTLADANTLYSPFTTIAPAGGISTTFTLPADDYHVGEIVPEGYDLLSINCGAGGSVPDPSNDDFYIQLFDNMTCVFTNTEATGTLTLVKTVPESQADSAPGFDFTSTFAPFNTTLQPTQTGSVGTPALDATPGIYTITEVNIPNGWYLQDLTCGDATHVVNGNSVEVTVDAGEDVICTFTNEQRSNIIIEKDVTTGDDRQFEFNFTDGDTNETFYLSETGLNTPELEDDLFDALLPGTYTITEENIPANWSLQDVTCESTGDASVISDVENGISIDLASGENVTCTFENAQISSSSLTVYKFYDTNENGVQDEGEDFLAGWEFTVYDSQDDEVTSGVTDANGMVSFELPVGDYEVCETLQDGWANTTPLCQEITVGGAGTNPDVTPGPNSATITFEDDQGTNSYQIEFLGVEGNTWTYEVTELEGKDLSHWSLGINTCLDNIISSSPEGAEIGPDGSTGGFLGIKWNTDDAFSSGEFTFTLDDSYPIDTVEVLAKAGNDFETAFIAGPNCDEAPIEEATLIFGNVDITGSITIVKNEVPDSDQNFFFEIRDGDDELVATPIVSDGNPVTTTDLLPGSYDVTEIFAGFGSGYVFGGAVCDNGVTLPADPSGNDTTVSLDLAADEHITCTFTNQQRVSLVIYKETIPDGDPTEFDFTQDFRSDLGENFTLTDGNFQQYVEGLPGTYTVTEDLPENWVLNDVTCDGAEVETLENGIEITLEYGDNVSCTFTNQFIPAPGRVIVNKYEDLNEDGQRQNTPEPGLQGWTFNLYNSNEELLETRVTGPNGYTTFSGLDQGTYEICEIMQDGWTNSTPLCQTVEIVESGETARLDFGNYQLPLGTVSVTKAVQGEIPQEQAGTSFQFCLSGENLNAPLCEYVGIGGTATWTDLAPGSYTVNESTPPANWFIVGGDNHSFELGYGGFEEHTIVNGYDAPPPPEQVGTITVIKRVVNAPDQHESFTICITNPVFPADQSQPNCYVVQNDGDQVSWTVVIPEGEDSATYNVFEVMPLPENWSAQNASANVTVTPNSTSYHTITNTYAPPPPPRCEGGVGPQSHLSGYITIDGLTATGHVTNNSDVEGCVYPVGLASYEKYDEEINNQIMFANNLQSPTIAPGETYTFTVELPECATQVDLFYGHYIPNFAAGERFGSRLFDAIHLPGNGYCVADEPEVIEEPEIIDEEPVEETPVEEPPVEEDPVDDTPVEQPPGEELPGEDTPTGENG